MIGTFVSDKSFSQDTFSVLMTLHATCRFTSGCVSNATFRGDVADSNSDVAVLWLCEFLRADAPLKRFLLSFRERSHAVQSPLTENQESR